METTSPTVGGDDTIRIRNTAGGTGYDYILGGPGDNQITMADGNAYIIGASGQIQFYTSTTSQAIVNTLQSTDQGTGGNETIQTGNGDHTIIGGDGANAIWVGDGNNTIFGHNGTVQYQSSGLLSSLQTMNPTIGSSALIIAGDGNNIIFGGAGVNAIWVGDGSDIIMGHDGYIQFFASGRPSLIETTDPQLAGHVGIIAGDGNNVIFGGSGSNAIGAGDGDNIIFGSNGMVNYQSPGLVGTIQTTNAGTGGDDLIAAGNGNNIILGGAGSNMIGVGDGNNTILGHDGYIHFFSSGTASLIEATDLQLAASNVIDAGDGNNIVFGGSGSDTITVGNGDNIVFGDNGMVTYQSSGVLGTIQTISSGTGGDDTITGGNGSNYVFGGFGNDTITLGGVTSTSGSQSSASVIIGDSGVIEFDTAGLLPVAVYSVDNATGGNDVIRTAAGNNILIGGAANDRLYGGTGDDIIIGDGGKITWAGNTEIIQSIDIREGGDDYLSGGGGRNIMIGDYGNNTFVGNFKNDIMIGRFAYIVVVNGRAKEVSSFWYGDDTLANSISSLYSQPGNGSQSRSETLPLTSQASWGTGLAAGTQFQVSAPTVGQGPAAGDLQAQQQQQSSHPGSYAVTASQPGPQQQQGQPQQGQQDEQQLTPGQAGGQQQGQDGQSSQPSGTGPGTGEPPGGNNEGSLGINPGVDIAAIRTDEWQVDLKEYTAAFGAVASANAGRTAVLNRDGFRKLKEEERRRRFLPWFGGEVGKASREPTSRRVTK
jgi:Ca2+-binding RTX toxin-like protein